MVEYKATGNNSEVAKSIIAILQEAESSGKLEEITEHQVVDLKVVEQKLG